MENYPLVIAVAALVLFAAVLFVEFPVRITVSGGLAMYPTHGHSTTELLRSADDALYESKRQGRNRILLATSVAPDFGIARGTQAVQAPRKPNVISIVTGLEPVKSPLGNSGGDVNA